VQKNLPQVATGGNDLRQKNLAQGHWCLARKSLPAIATCVQKNIAASCFQW